MAVDESGTLATARVKLVADARGMPEDVRRQTEKGMAQEGQKAGSTFGKRMVAAIGAAVAVGVAVVGKQLISGLKQSVEAASDLNEVTQKSQVVFGKSAKDIQKFAATAATSIGQSKTAAMDAATTFAIYGKAANLTGKDLTGFSTKMVKLSSDMASFSNSTPEEAVAAIGSALRGEFDPIERYGVLLNETTVKNQALKMGLIETTKDALTPQQRVLAVQAQILKQTGDAQGDFARNTNGLANQQRIAAAQIEDLKAKIGTSLLPTVTKLTQVFNKQVIPAFNTLWTKHGPAITKTFENVGLAVANFATRVAQGDFSAYIDKARDAFDRLKATAGPALAELRAQVGPASAGVKNDLVPALKQLKEDGGQGLADAIGVGAVALRFLAEHSDLLAKALPYLVGGLVAFKVAQLASNVAMAISPALRIAEIVATRQQTAAIIANTAARGAETTATAAGTAATAANTGAQNAGILARTRAIATTAALRVATIASTAATWLGTVATTAFGVALKVAMGPIGIVIAAVGVLTGAVVYLYKNNETARKIIDNSWKWIKDSIKDVGDWFSGTLWPMFRRHIDNLKLAFEVMRAVVRSVWNRFRSDISTTWNNVKGVFNAIKTFITQTIPNAFKTGVAAIGRFWSGLQELARKPIVFVVGFVNRLIRGYNKIAKVFKAPEADEIPGFAHGGLIPGSPSDVDNLMAEGPKGEKIKLATGEYIVNSRATAKNLPLLNAVNNGEQGFADGGLFGAIKGFFTNPAKYIRNLAGNIGDLAEKFGNSGLVQTLTGMGRALLDAVVNKAKDMFSFGGSGTGGAMFGKWPSSPGAQRGDSGVWRAIVAMIRSTGPISGAFGNGYRPGDPKWHGSGRAVDWMGYNQDALASFLASRGPLELIHRTNSRDYAYTRGRNKGSFNNALMQAHRNHIHIAFADGGYVPSFDSGGVLAPGYNTVYNGTGGPEALTRADQLRLHPADLETLGSIIAREMRAALGAGNYSAGRRASLYSRGG